MCVCSILNDTIDWLDVSQKIANRLIKTFYWIERNELVGTACLAVERANNKYDSNKSHNKDRLAYLYSKGYYLSIDILRANRTIFRTNRNIIINETNLRYLKNSQYDTGLEEIEVSQEHSLPTTCEDLLCGLTEREKIVLRLKYEQDYTFIKIGNYLNLSNASAWKIHNNAITKLKELRVDYYK